MLLDGFWRMLKRFIRHPIRSRWGSWYSLSYTILFIMEIVDCSVQNSIRSLAKTVIHLLIMKCQVFIRLILTQTDLVILCWEPVENMRRSHVLRQEIVPHNGI